MESASAARTVVTPSVSMTTFIDYCVAGTGTKRLSTVRKAKEFYEQDSSTYALRDYYLALRWAARSLLEDGDPSELDRCVRTCATHRRAAYNEVADGLRRWARGKHIEWVGVTKQTWHGPGLDVRVSPEVGVMVNDEPWVIKLHFKTEQPTKRLLDPALHLLNVTHGSHGKVGILDVRRSTLFKVTRRVPDIDLILEADAVSFAHMWSSA